MSDPARVERSRSDVDEKYPVYALDQIGFGNSDKPLIDYKIETLVEFL